MFHHVRIGKMLFLALPLVMLCLLASSCKPLSEMEDAFGSGSHGNTVNTENMAIFDVNEIPYNYAGSMIGIEGANFCDAGDAILFIVAPYTGNTMLYTLDKKTGYVDTFCQDAACSHDTLDCAAFDLLALEVYDGIIYALLQVYVPSSEPGVLGQYVSQLAQLKNGRFTLVLDAVRAFRHYGSHTYVTTLDGTLLRYAENMAKPETLLADESYYFHVFIDGWFYYINQDSILSRMELANSQNIERFGFANVLRTDGEKLYYTDENNYMYRCELDGSHAARIHDATIFDASIAFDADYIYFAGHNPTDITDPVNNHIYRLRKDGTASAELLADVGSQTMYITSLYGGDNLFLQMVGGGAPWFINKDGTGLTQLVLP